MSKAQNELCARATGWRKTVKLRCVAWRRFQSIRLDCEKCFCSAAVSTLSKLASQFSTVRSGPEGIDKYNKGKCAAAVFSGRGFGAGTELSITNPGRPILAIVLARLHILSKAKERGGVSGERLRFGKAL